jgi:peptidoglycan hydrolase-like protein with peptidoglycan-binding domain
MRHTKRAARGPLGVVAVVAIVVAACSVDPEAPARATPTSAPPSTSTAPPTTAVPTTTTTTTTTTVPLAPRIDVPGMGVGSRGDAVRALEERLVQLRYDPGRIDGVYDSATMHAVLAFQKTHGLARTGRATPEVLDRLATAQLPAELVPGGGATKVEVDLPRQILLLYKDGALFRIVDVSTGSGRRYCVRGAGCARAVTPGGSFRVTRRISGWRRSKLGLLYNPLYFNGGIAIHGAPSVPAHPASHGCVRIPMYVSYWFPREVPNGTPVYVIGGPRAPAPFNEPAPGEEPPTTPSTTAPTTTVPTTEPTTVTTTAPTTTTTTATTTTTTAVDSRP